MTHIFNSIINAGLEPYLGFLHKERAGKPSLVLDLMEEYRSWVVDRIIITIRNELKETNHELNLKIRKKIILGVQKTFITPYSYKKQRLKLESILQRQVYHLSSCCINNKEYKPYFFRW